MVGVDIGQKVRNAVLAGDGIGARAAAELAVKLTANK